MSKNSFLKWFYFSIAAGFVAAVLSPDQVFFDSMKYGLIGLMFQAISGTIPERVFKYLFFYGGVLLILLGQVLLPVKASLG